VLAGYYLAVQIEHSNKPQHMAHISNIRCQHKIMPKTHEQNTVSRHIYPDHNPVSHW